VGGDDAREVELSRGRDTRELELRPGCGVVRPRRGDDADVDAAARWSMGSTRTTRATQRSGNTEERRPNRGRGLVNIALAGGIVLEVGESSSRSGNQAVEQRSICAATSSI
jgi:hypothetical protein